MNNVYKSTSMDSIPYNHRSPIMDYKLFLWYKSTSMGCMININHGKSFIMEYNLRVYGNGNGHGMYNRQYMDIWRCLKIDITKFHGYLILYFPKKKYFSWVYTIFSQTHIYIYTYTYMYI